MTRGNCYVTCEALYHLLGGKEAGYTPHTLKHEGDVHWYLVLTTQLMETPAQTTFAHLFHQTQSRVIVDPTVSQFKTPPDYSKGRGRGFLTKKPSKRAAALMQKMVYQ